MNAICLRLDLPEAELNESKLCNAGLTSKNTLRILNAIKPVTRVFTAMVAAKAVRVNVFPQAVLKIIIVPVGFPSDSGTSEATQVASRRDKLKSVYYQMKID